MSRYSLWLKKYDDKKKTILEDLNRYKKSIQEIQEKLSIEELIFPVSEYEKPTESLNMCFVDGGEGLEELLGCAIYYIRASGLLLHQKKEKFVRDSDLGILRHDENTKERVELLRAIMEIDIAERCILEHAPEYVFLDGSLYVNSSKREVQCPEYEIFRKKFSRLLKLSQERKIHLCGISEDSQSRLLMNHLVSKHDIKFPSFMTDSSMLKFFAGDKKFVTKEFVPESKFQFQNNSHAINFPTVYLQPTRVSNPLRIDVPGWEKKFPEIISLIAALSKGSRWYGYPCPLYLVHLDAKIEKKQSEWNTLQIVHHISRDDPKMYDAIFRKNRRASRPER